MVGGELVDQTPSPRRKRKADRGEWYLGDRRRNVVLAKAIVVRSQDS